jgi:hypothetical protein
MSSADPRDPIYGQPFVGSADVQTVTVSGAPTGGTFTLTFNGQTTAGIAFNANAAAVQAALVALSTIGAGGVTVTGTGPYVVTFAGTKAPGFQNPLTASAAGLTGGTPAVTVAHTTLGSPMLQAASRASASQTVLDMYRMANVRIATSDTDVHRTPNGNLYHE